MGKQNAAKDSKRYEGKSNRGKGCARNAKGKYDRTKGKEEYEARSVENNLDRVKSNDISWYTRNPVLFADATRVPFDRLAGAPVRTILGYQKSTSYTNVSNFESQCAMMTIEYLPTPGVCHTYSDAPNRAFRSIYSYIYSHTSGALQIQQGDIALVCTAMKSIIGMIGYAKKAIYMSYLWSSLNLNYPELHLQAMGFEPNSIIGHQDELRERLNNVIRSFNAIAIPNFLNTFVREYSLSHNIYADSDNINAQLYSFRPAGYYVYTMDPDKAEKLVYHAITVGSGMIDYNLWIDYIEDQLEAIRSSSSFALVSGAIQRAYNASQMMQLDEVTAETRRLPIVDVNMNHQIHNMRFMELSNLDITVDAVSNNLIFAPSLNSAVLIQRCLLENSYLDSYNGDTSPEFQMEATRLMPAVRETGAIGDIELTLGTEVPQRCHIFWREGYFADSNSNPQFKTMKATINGYLTSDGPSDSDIGSEIGANFKLLKKWQEFNLSPMLMWIKFVTPQGGSDYTKMHDFDIFFQRHVWTTINFDQIKGLNNVALLSMYTTDNPGSLGV